jgi:Family of unknown function (DUF6049)
MQSVRTVVRTLTAVFLALAGPVLAAPAVLAHAQEIQQSSRTDAAASHQLTISINEMTPNFATQTTRNVTVRGTLTNHTGSAIADISVQLLTSAQWIGTRSGMDSFASGSSASPPVQAGMSYSLSALANGATVRWAISFNPVSFNLALGGGYTTFGVYPLEVDASSPVSSYLASDRTFLPFWPGNGAADPLNTAWIWPLIDQPQQGACGQTLATNSLAGSLGSGGRLGTLLATGTQWAQRDHLTWAVDPALLSDANVMRGKYFTGGGDAACTGRTLEPASAAARTWLSSLSAGTAGDEMFLTPYADADVSALTHAGLDATLKTAYQVGESVAGKILPDAFGKKGAGTGGGGAPSVAWPAGGTADASTASSLASNAGINTVVLHSGELPPTTPPYDNALGKITTGAGTQMNVLLADSQLTSILGSASAGSPAAARFAAEQDFLAETAMITAEAPFPRVTRSLVIAPPRRWDPSATEAATLLKLTSQAPWLHTVGLSSLAKAASHLKVRESLPRNKVSKTELGHGYLDQIEAVNASAALYKNLLYKPDAAVLQTINEAVATTTSTAWRGTNSAGGRLALTELSYYLSDNEKQVTIITGKKVLLAGASGQTPVSVQNLSQLPVQVQVVAIPVGTDLSVGTPHKPIPIQPGQTQLVKISLQSRAITTTTMQLQLETENGSLLPQPAQVVSVQVTRYGRALLVLIAAALGVLVLTSVARGIRRRLNDGGADGGAGGTG